MRGPKLRGAKVEGSKTLQGKDRRQIYPAEFFTPQPLPRRVFDSLTFALRRFGAMQCNKMQPHLFCITYNVGVGGTLKKHPSREWPFC